VSRYFSAAGRWALCVVLTGVVVGSAAAASIQGTRGNDVIRGTAKADTIYGMQGNDRIVGGAGNDRLLGGPGNDRVTGGAGNDRLVGGPGRDVLDCGPGVDDAMADARDTVRSNCEVVSGLPDVVQPDEPAPAPAPPLPPPSPTQTAVTPGAYKGATSTGNHVFFSVLGDRTITGFRVNDMRQMCGNGGYIYGALDFGSYAMRIGNDGSFTETYDGPGTIDGTPATLHLRLTGRVQGAIASGTVQTASEWNHDGSLWRCSTELQTWTATLT